MTASALAQFDRLSSDARHAAEGAAHEAGLSLNEWLGRLIAQTAAAEGIAAVAVPRTATPPRPQPRAVVQPLPVRQAAPPRPVAPAVAPFAVPQPAPSSAAIVSAPALRQRAGSGGTGSPTPAPDTASVMLSPSVLEAGTVGTRGDEAEAPEALTEAIARDGLSAPILVRRKPGGGDRYEIVAGRRRWRVAKRLELTQIPAVVTDIGDSEAILASLRENLREGTLSPVDEARAYLRLLTEFSLDPRDVCSAIGCNIPHVVQALRLLGLSPRLRGLIAGGRLSSAQAYELLDVPDPERTAEQMLSEQAGVDEALHRVASVPGGRRS